jgi:sulfoxide reductase heme-binding subunit YedZ
MIRRLGGKRWQTLHRAIYLSAVLGVIHYYWLVKSDHRKPLEYAVIVGILLAYRFGAWIYGRTHGAGAGGAVRREPLTAETG